MSREKFWPLRSQPEQQSTSDLRGVLYWLLKIEETEGTNQIEHQKVTQIRCFRSDGFCRWSRIFFSLGSRNIAFQIQRAGLRDHPSFHNSIKTVFSLVILTRRNFAQTFTEFPVTSGKRKITVYQFTTLQRACSWKGFGVHDYFGMLLR